MTHRNDTQPTQIDWSLVGWAALIGAAGALAAGIVLVASLNVPTGSNAVIALVFATGVAAILLAVLQVLAQRLWGGRTGPRTTSWAEDTPTIPFPAEWSYLGESEVGPVTADRIATLIRAHTPASTLVLAGNGSRIQVTCDCGATTVINASTFNASPTGSIDALSEHVDDVIAAEVRANLTRGVL